MTIARLLAAAAAITAIAAAAPVAAGQFDGTWKYQPGSMEASKTPSVFTLIDGTYSCTTCAPAYSVKADGAFHPVAGDPYRDEAAVRVNNPRSITITSRKGGKPMSTRTMTVAPDDVLMTIDFKDTSAENGVPVVGKGVARRAAPGPKGSHAVSGSWLDTADFSANDAGTSFTFASAGDTLTFTTPTGQRYVATIGGQRAPVLGDPGWDGVTLVRTGPVTLVETDYRGDQTISVNTYVVSVDGRAIRNTFDDRLRGATSTATMVKQ